ncbi:hypothetical protein [Sorangium sp. So ce1000]|uniref:hypothetical protein n=1 Tax=Sorangium sp. So ce1000 TaxID=3133325 RepID=UPI003F6227AF
MVDVAMRAASGRYDVRFRHVRPAVGSIDSEPAGNSSDDDEAVPRSIPMVRSPARIRLRKLKAE